MSNLKDTDFDDLFRRASDKYPLRTDSSDWDRMAAALEKDPSPDADDVDNTDRRRRRRFFWWFLLLPLAGIGYYTIHQSGHTGNKPADANGSPATSTAATKPAATMPAATKPSTPAGAAKGDGGINGADDGAAKTGPNGDATAKNNGDATAPALSGGLAAGAAGSRPAEGQSLAHGMPRKAHQAVNSNDPNSSRKGIRATDGDVPVRPEATSNVRPEPNRTNGADKTNENRRLTDRFADNSTQIDPRTNPITAAFSLRAANINQQRARIADPYALNVAVKAKEITKDSTKPKPKSKNQSYLYAGIVGAPDLSTVKFQKTKGVGTTFGVLIGFAFNSHWAIETGAYVDRKRYYTDGEYFNTKSVRVPYNSDLLNVDGTCYMWEIPLNVRYTFNPAGKTRWFATAGLSTYLMNREKYNYAYKYYSGTQIRTSSWDMKKPSQYPFSIIGFSAGFEQRLGNVGDLRVEPYVRVPLGGIGTGSLPILSTGINIGITRRLWK